MKAVPIAVTLLFYYHCFASVAAFHPVLPSAYVGRRRLDTVVDTQRPIHQFAKEGDHHISRLHLLSPVDAWSAYNEALEANPLLVKSLTAGVILGAADLAGQTFEKSQQQLKNQAPTSSVDTSGIDWARAGRFAVFGLVLQAPWNHFYYLALDGQIPPTPDDPFSETNIIKVVIDQFVQAPIFTVLIFVFLGLLEGKGAEAIQNQLKNDYKETILANWKLWVPATIVNIGFVPPILRVLYLNIVFFFWSIYLSLVINKQEEK